MIERKDADGIRVLKLAHGKVSAMDIELGEALIAELKDAMDPSVKAVIVTGTGSSFSAGVDLFRLIKDGPEYGRRFLPVLDEFLLATLTFPKPWSPRSTATRSPAAASSPRHAITAS